MARISRLFGVATGTLALAVVLGACATPVEEPTVAPTVSEPSQTATTDPGQAAFEAAEATYRAYIDAVNAVDFANPSTFEPIYSLSIEPVTGVDRKAFAEASAEGLTIEGDTVVASVKDVRDDPSVTEIVTIEVCNDLSEVDVLDRAGVSIVAPDRPDAQVYEIELTADPSAADGFVLSARRGVRSGESC